MIVTACFFFFNLTHFGQSFSFNSSSTTNTQLPLGCRGAPNLLKDKITIQDRKTEHPISDISIPVFTPSATPFFRNPPSVVSFAASPYTSALMSQGGTHFSVAYFHANQCIFSPIFSKSHLHSAQ